MIDEGNSLLKHIGGPPAQMFAVEKGNLQALIVIILFCRHGVIQQQPDLSLCTRATLGSCWKKRALDYIGVL